MIASGIVAWSSEEMTTDFMHTSVFVATDEAMELTPCPFRDGACSCEKAECIAHLKQQKSCAFKVGEIESCGCGRKLGET